MVAALYKAPRASFPFHRRIFLVEFAPSIRFPLPFKITWLTSPDTPNRSTRLVSRMRVYPGCLNAHFVLFLARSYTKSTPEILKLHQLRFGSSRYSVLNARASQFFDFVLLQDTVSSPDKYYLPLHSDIGSRCFFSSSLLLSRRF